MDIKASLPNTDFSLTTATLIELRKYADSKTSTITDGVVARVNAAMLVVFALGDVIVHAAVAVAKTTIAAVELPLYVAGRSGDFTGTATDVWCHTTHSIRSAITIFGSLAGIAKPQWTLNVYSWMALDVTAPKGLLAEAAQQIREAARNAWNSPHRNLLIGCAVTAAFVALGYVYLAPPITPTVNNGGSSTPPITPAVNNGGSSTPPITPTVNNGGSSTPPITPTVNNGGSSTPPIAPTVNNDGSSKSPVNPNSGGPKKPEENQPIPDAATGGLWENPLVQVGVIGGAMWWAARRLQRNSRKRSASNLKRNLEVPTGLPGSLPSNGCGTGILSSTSSTSPTSEDPSDPNLSDDHKSDGTDDHKIDTAFSRAASDIEESDEKSEHVMRLQEIAKRKFPIPPFKSGGTQADITEETVLDLEDGSDDTLHRIHGRWPPRAWTRRNSAPGTYRDKRLVKKALLPLFDEEYWQG